MRTLLILLFGIIFVWMIVMTALTSIKMPIWNAFSTFGDNPWATATLWDAYFGFVTLYVWVAWREVRFSPRILWFVLIQLLRLKNTDSPSLLPTSRNG